MNRLEFTLFTIILVLFFSCSNKTNEQDEVISSAFEGAVSKGTLDAVIDEASGLVASINNSEAYWTLNDSEGVPCLFLVNEKGTLLWTVCIEGIKNRDWEDIAIGPGPQPGKNYIYIAEIGDNKAEFDKKYLFRVEEPSLSIKENNRDTTVQLTDTLSYNYPDGIRDAETLIIDPDFNKFIIVSKREDEIHVYEGDLNLNYQVLKMVGTLPFRLAVAGDLSPDGTEILIKNYDQIYYWQRTDSLVSVGNWIVNNKFQTLPYEAESQGESITWKRDASGYFTVSEVNDEIPVDMLFYKRTASLPAN